MDGYTCTSYYDFLFWRHVWERLIVVTLTALAQVEGKVGLEGVGHLRILAPAGIGLIQLENHPEKIEGMDLKKVVNGGALGFLF